MRRKLLAAGWSIARRFGVLGASLMMIATAGCAGISAEQFRDTQRQLQLSQERVRQLESQVAAEQEGTRVLQAQIARLRGLDRKETMGQLVAPTRIDFASMSGGYDTDGEVGDDGIVLYVQPYDDDGHVIKAAGSLRVTILDPLSPPDQNVVAEYRFDVPATRKLWYGRLMTQHFTIRCPWPNGRFPLHTELTAHVAFFDLLTGRTLTAQKAFKIMAPPGFSPPTSQP